MSTREAPLFFFGAMSPYSWLAAERIDSLIPGARWGPVFAGGLFKAHDRTSWGLTERRKQGMADCEARARVHGLGEICWPDPWPTLDLAVGRAMFLAGEHNRLREFALEAMRLAFREGRDLGELPAILEVGERVGLDAAETQAAVTAPRFKIALREATDAALARGVFGVPTVAIGAKLFWGDDQLEQAATEVAFRVQGLEAR